MAAVPDRTTGAPYRAPLAVRANVCGWLSLPVVGDDLLHAGWRDAGGVRDVAAARAAICALECGGLM